MKHESNQNYVDVIGQVQQDSGALLDAISAVQRLDGYLSDAGVEAIAKAFGLPASRVYETASFYSMLHFQPKGVHVVEICRNAPCHVSGAQAVIDALEHALGIHVGETTADGQITLQYTECIGQCQSGPNLLVDGSLVSHVTPDQIPTLVGELRKGGTKTC